MHENYYLYIPCLNAIDSENPRLNYFELDFADSSKVNSLKIGATVNKYDIINEIGMKILGIPLEKLITNGYPKIHIT